MYAESLMAHFTGHNYKVINEVYDHVHLIQNI